MDEKNITRAFRPTLDIGSCPAPTPLTPLGYKFFVTMSRFSPRDTQNTTPQILDYDLQIVLTGRREGRCLRPVNLQTCQMHENPSCVQIITPVCRDPTVCRACQGWPRRSGCEPAARTAPSSAAAPEGRAKRFLDRSTIPSVEGRPRQPV